MSEKMIEDIKKRLDAKTIHDIRQIARAVGVQRPADGKKERLIEGILKIATGEADPAPPPVRGAHPKSKEYDRLLVADILRCREITLFAGEANSEETLSDGARLTVSSGAVYDPLDFTVRGILEKSDGKWFIRVNGGREDYSSDVYVSPFFVNGSDLREGDFICGKAKRETPDEMAGLYSLTQINGLIPQAVGQRLDFDGLTYVFPDKRLKLSRGKDDITGRLLDLFSPLGAGQRAIVTGAHGVGKTSVLRDIADGLKHNNPDLKIILLLVDARPEEAAEFRRCAAYADVFASSIDAGNGGHIRTAKLALEYAKRLAEQNFDVALILDDLNSLARAYNSLIKITPYLEAETLGSVKKFLAAAKNTEEGGSLTIIAALNDGGDDPFDSAVYSGLCNVGNARISLSRKCARMRIYPPLDIDGTYASGSEKFVPCEELEAAANLCEKPLSEIIRILLQKQSNEELFKKP